VTVPVILRPVARVELEEATDYFRTHDSPRTAERFVRRVNDVLALLETNPYFYAKVDGETREALVRKFRYAVYYRSLPDRIDVLAVIHTSRDPAIWQSRV
jgi:plasmid stabilization system protein ParE